MNHVFIGIGSNLGDRLDNISESIERIWELKGTEIKKISHFYISKPYGFISDNFFINCAIEIYTSLSPFELLDQLLKIERDMGRIRNSLLYCDRIIDLDILIFDSLILRDERLWIPHPKISERLFVLCPLMDLCGDLILPDLNIPINKLYNMALTKYPKEDYPLRID